MNATYRAAVRAAHDENMLDELVEKHTAVILKHSPHVGWWLDQLVCEDGGPPEMDLEAWVAAEPVIAFYAAWLDSNVLNLEAR